MQIFCIRNLICLAGAAVRGVNRRTHLCGMVLFYKKLHKTKQIEYSIGFFSSDDCAKNW